jgi:hypothetical protein
VAERKDMKKAIAVWVWSAAVLARSMLALIVLAAFVGAWALAAYEWLWIPESSVLVLVLSLAWAIGLVGAATAALAGTSTSAMEAADEEAGELSLASMIRFGGKRFAEGLLFVIAASFIGLALDHIFVWVHQHSIEAASFLTLHLQKPVSYLLIDKCITVIAGLIGIAVATSLLGFLMAIFGSGWKHACQRFGEVLLGGFFGLPFLSGVLSVVVFGGVAYQLANWRPTVSAGLADYSQLGLRVALVLTLVAAGWFFWLLCLAWLDWVIPVETVEPDDQDIPAGPEP